MDKPLYVNTESEGPKKKELDAIMHDFPEDAILRHGKAPHLKIGFREMRDVLRGRSLPDMIYMEALPDNSVGIEPKEGMEIYNVTHSFFTFKYEGRNYQLAMQPI